MTRRRTSPPAGRADATGTVDAYLAALPVDQRSVLENLRATIRAAAPSAEEAWSYGMPAFRLDGILLVSYSAFKNHCSFFPMNASLTEQFADELAGWPTAKGTIRFTPEKPLPAAVVKKMVKARAAENRVRAQKRRSGRA